MNKNAWHDSFCLMKIGAGSHKGINMSYHIHFSVRYMRLRNEIWINEGRLSMKTCNATGRTTLCDQGSIHSAGGRLTASSREVSKLRDAGLDFSNRSEMRGLRYLLHPISRLRNFTKSYGKTSVCLVNKALELTTSERMHRKRTAWSIKDLHLSDNLNPR